MANDPNDHQAERWQARLASLETRLEMLETSIKGEADRMRLSAESVGGLADELRGLLGGGRNLVDLLNDFGDRVSVLASLEKRVADASREVSDEVSSKLDDEASQRRDRDAALEAGFARLVEQVGNLQM